MTRQRLLGLLCSAVAACSDPSLGDNAGHETPKEWVAQMAGPTEAVLCMKERDADWFYVSREGPTKLRVGSRLAFPTEAGASPSFIRAWSFQWNDGAEGMADSVPRLVKQEGPSPRSPYLSSVSEYDLKPGQGALTIAVTVKRCPSSECELNTKKNDAEREYRVVVCTI